MPRLRLSGPAESDVDQIFLYGVREYGLAAADSYLGKLRKTLDFLAEFPGVARERTNIRPPVRLYRQQAHNILYVIVDEDVLILRVLHHSANWIDHF